MMMGDTSEVHAGRIGAPLIKGRIMERKLTTLLVLAAVPLLLLCTARCAGQSSDTTETAEQAPPPASDTGVAGGAAPEHEQAPPEQKPAPAVRPQRTHTASRSTGTVPEERPRNAVPAQPAAPPPVTVTLPAGTALAVTIPEAISSAAAQAGDRVTATLKNPVIAGDRVAFPAGSRVEGKISDVKSAKKGFKDTGGALSISFNRIVAPDGHSASIEAGFTRLATGSAGKKAGIIGGSAVGGAILGKMLGKDAKGAALLGGAIGTAVAGSTKGKEAVIEAGEEMTVNLQRPAEATLRP